MIAKPLMRCVPEKFSGPGENCQRNVTDLAGSLVTSSRPPGRPQKRPNDRTWNAGVAVRTADGSRRTADAGDEQCLRCGYVDHGVCRTQLLPPPHTDELALIRCTALNVGALATWV